MTQIQSHYRADPSLLWGAHILPLPVHRVCERQPKYQREKSAIGRERAIQEASTAKSVEAIIMEVNFQSRGIDVYPRSCSARERGKLFEEKSEAPGWRWCQNSGNSSISIFTEIFWGAKGPKNQLQAGPWIKESEKPEGFSKARKHSWRKMCDDPEKEAPWSPIVSKVSCLDKCKNRPESIPTQQMRDRHTRSYNMFMCLPASNFGQKCLPKRRRSG